jgi:hypothetical protein
MYGAMLDMIYFIATIYIVAKLSAATSESSSLIG